MNKIFFTIAFFLLINLSFFSNLNAQNEVLIWYFGKKAGVDFRSGKPVTLTNGVLSTEEGVATICDKTGKLLFYTDGISVWNAEHTLMPNGKELKGDPSSTQSGVVIPKPKASGLYYLFTVDNTANADGFCYSVVNMTAQAGLGDVNLAEKNTLLKTPVTEKLTAVKHRNGTDTWVIVHGWQNNDFYAYLVTEKGVSSTPVGSSVGSVHQGNTLNTQGYLKSNPDGTNLALALEDSQLFEIFDFDNATGKVSQPMSIKLSPNSYPYGIEFSPNGSVFYGSAAGTGKIYQYNLQAGSPEKIIASQLEVGSSPKKEWIGALQVAPDGKIYFPIYGTSFLGVIHQPNKVGMACQYENDYVNLGTGIAQLGLPTFNQSSFNQSVDVKLDYFDDKNIQIGKSVVLNNINFEYAKYDLKPTSFVELDKLVKVLKQDLTLKIKLSGHTDNIGNKSANIDLSNNRANAVKQYLKTKGIDENRIEYEGFGSGQPIATNTTDVGRAKNRRVEIQFNK